MSDEAQDLINTIYEKKDSTQLQNTSEKVLRKSSKPKYQIFDESEFTRGREVLGEIIVHGMIASGGTDIDWLIEHKGCFIILEFKGFHNDKINIPQGQMIAYEKLHEKLNQSTKCYLYIVGCDDIDFSNPDSPIWMNLDLKNQYHHILQYTNSILLIDLIFHVIFHMLLFVLVGF